MKLRALLCLALVGAAIAFWFGAHVSATEKMSTVASHNVVFGKEAIVIPGTTISKTDQEAMNQILSKYDKSLYRIDTYENGKLTKTQGKLSDVVTNKQLASEIAANVKRTGFTQSAVQIRVGLTTNPARSQNPGNTNNPARSQNPGTTNNPAHSQNPGTTNNPAHSQNPGTTNNPAHSQNPGTTNNPAHSQNPTPGTTTNPAKQNSGDELVERLRPILEKYRNK